MKLELSQQEISGLMRALLRSIEDTPGYESVQHEMLYSKLAAAYAETMDHNLRAAVGAAIDRHIGR